MILANIQKLERYNGIHSNLDIAIQYVLRNNLNDLVLGKTQILNDDVFVNIFEYQADNQVGDFFEGHKQYLDIHIVLKGKEKIAGLDIDKATLRSEFDIENDFGIYDGVAEYEVLLENDLCLIVFPEDLHEPKVRVNDEIVRKAVVKVKLV